MVLAGVAQDLEARGSSARGPLENAKIEIVVRLERASLGGRGYFMPCHHV